MTKLEFVDTHFHLWNLDHPDLYYSWLQPDSHHPQLGPRIHELGAQNYFVDDYIAETRDANVTKAVHVQAALGIDDPVKETEWLQAASDRTGFPNAIVAYADLSDPKIERELTRHRRHAALRGIRDFSEGDYLTASAFQRGYAMLAKFNLVCSLDCKWEDMEKARDLAAKFPDVSMVLDHCGFPRARTKQYFHNWRDGIDKLAEQENVVCKISGLGMVDQSWNVDSIRPWVLHCIDAFGPERCMFGSNWPVDKLFSTYDVLIDAYAEIIAGFSAEERAAMFSENAMRLYRI